MLPAFGFCFDYLSTVKVRKFIQEYAAVYLTAGLENILEEVLTQCLFAYVILEFLVSANLSLWRLLPHFHGHGAPGAQGYQSH